MRRLALAFLFVGFSGVTAADQHGNFQSSSRPMSVYWDTLRTCYKQVAACVGVRRPPRPPRIVVVADEPHLTNGVLRHGFACGTYCLDPPPDCPSDRSCPVPPGYCTQSATAYCAGEYDNPPRRGQVIVSDKTMAAIPHEFIHHLIQKRHLFPEGGKDDPGDGGHVGEWWHCERKAEVPACAGLWP
jgi:hypothetical protein